LDPPPKPRIDQAMATLKATGAVEEGQRPANAPQWGAHGEDAWYVATPIGQCLARLPCDIRLGKMVLYGALFGGVDAVWTVAATLSHRSPLAAPFAEAKKLQARQAHCTELLARDAPPSDHMALNTAYMRWDEARKSGHVDTFCRKMWLNNQVLQTIRDIRKDFLDSLKSSGFCEQYSREELPVQELRSTHLASALIFAGLYPNLARVDPRPDPTNKIPNFSAGGEQLNVHPGSLCHGRVDNLHRTNHRWICFHSKMRTSKVFLRDCTFIMPHALLLFGGDTNSLNIHPAEKSLSIGLGAEKGWICMYVAPRVSAAVRQLRHRFEALLRRKASNPKQPLPPEDRDVIIAYVAVLGCVDCDS